MTHHTLKVQTKNGCSETQAEELDVLHQVAAEVSKREEVYCVTVNAGFDPQYIDGEHR